MDHNCPTCHRPLDDDSPEAVRLAFAAFAACMDDNDTNSDTFGEWSDWDDVSTGDDRLVKGFGYVKKVHYDDTNVHTDSYGDKSGTSYLVLEVKGVLLRQDMTVDSYGGVNPRGELRIVQAQPKTVTVISYE